MHIPVTITIACYINDETKIKDYLIPNRLIHVTDLYRISTAAKHITPSNITLKVVGIVFDYEGIPILESSLKRYGTIRLNKGKVKIINLTTILSASVIAAIVFVSLFARNFIEQSYRDLFEHPNANEIIKTLIIIGGSAGAGFLLEILIVYRERRAGHH